MSSKPWVKMKRAVYDPASVDRVRRIHGEAAAKLSAEAEVWANDQYTVMVRRAAPAPDSDMPVIVHLSIRNNDRSARHDWRDFQRIKNDIVGPECEGIELYPAESRLVDAANQFHLWVFDRPGFRIGLGFEDRDVRPPGDGSDGSVQRPWNPDEQPEYTDSDSPTCKVRA